MITVLLVISCFIYLKKVYFLKNLGNSLHHREETKLFLEQVLRWAGALMLNEKSAFE